MHNDLVELVRLVFGDLRPLPLAGGYNYKCRRSATLTLKCISYDQVGARTASITKYLTSLSFLPVVFVGDWWLIWV